MFKRKKTKTIKEMILEKQMEENARSRIAKTQLISEDTKIIVEQKSKIVNFFLIIIEIVKIIMKITLIMIICVLSTIGGTVLLNSVLREFFFETIHISFINF